MGGYKDGEWEWNLSWRRLLFNNEITMAVNFLKDVERSVIQQNGRDAWVWMEDPTGSYLIEGNHPQLQQGDDVSAIQTANQDKASNQSNVEAERRLKSIIECSAEVLEEAQHLWHLGENIGMEAATTNSDILHNYSSMECRDRKEAMEVDDIPCVGKPLMIGYPFRLFDAWLSNKDYTKVVRDCWSANQPMGWGGGGYALKCKLQNLKHRLKTWSRDNCGDLGSKVKQTQKKLNDLENSLTPHPSDQQVQELKRTQADLWEQSFLNESIVRQKSRSNYHPSGWGGYAFKQKLKFIKACIRQWILSNRLMNAKKIQDLKREMNALEAGISGRILTQPEVELNKSLHEQLWHAANAYESMLRQKARVKWLKEGDKNSAYFHKLINHRRRQNAIQGLIIEGVWVQDPSKVKNEALNHFKDRFSEQNLNRPTIDGVQLPSLGQSEKEAPVARFTKAEVTSAVWDCGGDKSPGPDGLNFNFIKQFWKILKPDFMRFLDEFYTNVSQQQDLTVSLMGHHVDNRWDWQIQWRRNFFDHEIDMGAAFMDEIDGVQIHLSRLDHLTWRADPSGSYSTKSAYNLLMEDGSSDYEDNASRIMWNLKIPPRAAAFSWRIFKNRLPTKANLRRRQVFLPSYSCPLCDVEEETVGHVMFSCTRTRSLWWEALRWVDRVGPFPTDPKDHFIQFSSWSSKRYIDNRWAVLWIALSMTIWKHRNSMVFNNQIFDSEKVMDEALFHTWAWLKLASMGIFGESGWEWKFSWRRYLFDNELGGEDINSNVPYICPILRGVFIDGSWNDDPHKVKEEVKSFFFHRFQEPIGQRPKIDGIKFQTVNQQQNNELLAPFMDEEIQKAIFKAAAKFFYEGRQFTKGLHGFNGNRYAYQKKRLAWASRILKHSTSHYLENGSGN
ncbi:Transposon TX1 uncharacterized protein [Glycine soja]